MTFFALFNVARQAFSKFLEILKTLTENVEAVDHKALLAAKTSNQKTASHHLAECLALLVGKADLFLSVLVKNINLSIRYSIRFKELGQFRTQALN